MWATLKSMDISTEEQFIVAGDLNSSETFDYLWRGGPRGNREIMDRMNALGFYDCLRMYKGQLTPTFRHSRKSFVHQLDHFYVTPRLLSRLTRCDVGSAERVFGSTLTLSDHLPIVADFVLPDRSGADAIGR
jgi:exonuclease III